MPHPDIEIRRVRDDAGLTDLIAVSSEAFGRDQSKMGALFRARLRDPTLGLFVDYADDEPAAAGRLEMPSGRSFAGLWAAGRDRRSAAEGSIVRWLPRERGKPSVSGFGISTSKHGTPAGQFLNGLVLCR